MAKKYRVRPMDSEWYQETIKCQFTCPVNTNAGGYVQAIARGRFAEAYELARRPNPLAGICGRVCAHPCEDACRRGGIDQPVAICALKRFAHEQAGPEQAASGRGSNGGAPEPLPARRPERIAVIGAGPAGLSAAHDLALLGYPVTVYEAQSVAGGMAYLGMPEFRIPREVIRDEVERILGLGVGLRLKVRLGRDLGLADLREQGYRAILIAIGLERSRDLRIEGSELRGILKGIDFLRQVNLGGRAELGGRVLVIGGGSVAVDVARTAVRQGAEECTVVALESRAEMPAHESEVQEAEREGISVINSRGPKRFLGSGGWVTGLETQDVKSVFDEQGRFNPVFHEDTEKVIEADVIILAIGQAPDLSFLAPADGVEVDRRGTIVVDPETLLTSAPGVFLAGDIAYGPKLIIDAIASGRRAAWSIHRHLGGRPRTRVTTRLVRYSGHRYLEDYLRIRRRSMPTISMADRNGNTEVEIGFTTEMAMEEARRCLRCNLNPWVDQEACILCGGCADICPYNCLKFVEPDRVEGDGTVAEAIRERTRALGEAGRLTVMLKDDTYCVRCGLCARRCPTGAMSMARFEIEEAIVSG